MYDVISLTPIKAQDRSLIKPWLLLERQGVVRMRYIEFDLFRQFHQILRGKEKSSVFRILRNLWGIIGLLVSRDRMVILGTEPFRSISFLVNRIKARHVCIWHGSWPWEEETFDYGRHSVVLRRIWRTFLRDTVCVCVNKPAYHELLGYDARAYHIPWPVDTALFRPDPEPKTVDITRVLFVGELTKFKGVDVLIDTIREHEWTGTRFVFAGRGPYRSELARLARDGFPVDLNGFVANRDALVRLMQSATMLVLPLVMIGLWWASASKNITSMKLLETEATSLNSNIKLASPQNSSVISILPLLNEASALTFGFDEQNEPAPLGMRFGLYQGDKLARNLTIPAYKNLLENAEETKLGKYQNLG